MNSGVVFYTLQRTQQDNYGTFGEFYDPTGKLLCYTVERPWINNQPKVSCIPAGIYDVETYQSPTKGQVWQLQDVPDRSNIEIHEANFPSQLEGCIAVGDSIGIIEGQKGVTNSDKTYAMLQQELPDSFIMGIHDPESA